MQTFIKPVVELKKQSKEEFKKKELDKKVDNFILNYKQIVKKQLKIQSKYNLNKIINNKKHFEIELDEEANKKYINIGNKIYNLKESIIYIIDLFDDHLDKISFKTFEKMIDKINSEKHSKYFIKTILTEPFTLIDIQSSPINFNQAYEIHKKLNIPISDDELINKWAIFALQYNNGSFYKIKSHYNSNNNYKTYSDKCFKQGWYFKLREFCEDKKLLGKYSKYLEILNSLLIEHSQYKGCYGITEFVELEKSIGETIMNEYYDSVNDINEDKFTIFIESFENKKNINLLMNKLMLLEVQL